jgi:two-component system chemotaxis response regulator CheB
MTNTTSPSTAGQGHKQIHVLLADDSAVIRGALGRIIEKDPVIKIISSVSNGELAIAMAQKKKPHVIILDIEMPVMDGLTALPKILEVSPQSKVIMFSSLTEKGATSTLKAFALGAVECLAKPSSAQDVGEGSDFQKNLLALLKNLVPEKIRIQPEEGDVRPTRAPLPPKTDQSAYQLRKDPMAYRGKPAIVAIGSSTGGPQALFMVLKNLKDLDVPIVITQHMPATFTKILAEHITLQTGIPAFEGAQGMLVEKGKAYVAPGGFHMKIVREDGELKIRIDNGPPENFCRPSVEPMYRSVIELFGSKVLGVILTGMGNDGLGGAKILVERGGVLIAQDEASSVVWGMPGAVARAGLCSEVLPLIDIGPWIRKAVLG